MLGWISRGYLLSSLFLIVKFSRLALNNNMTVSTTEIQVERSKTLNCNKQRLFLPTPPCWLTDFLLPWPPVTSLAQQPDIVTDPRPQSIGCMGKYAVLNCE